MIDSKRADRSVQTGLSSRSAWRLLTRRRRTLILFIETLLIVAVAVIGHLTGRAVGSRNLDKREEIIVDLNAVDKRKAEDPFLQPNDIVALSEDRVKSIVNSVTKTLTQGIPGLMYRPY